MLPIRESCSDINISQPSLQVICPSSFHQATTMVLTARALALAAPLTSLLLSATITASPLGIDDGSIDVSMFGIHRRQDPGPSGTDPSGILPEDEDDAQIIADGTGNLRKGMSSSEKIERRGNLNAI